MTDEQTYVFDYFATASYNKSHWNNKTLWKEAPNGYGWTWAEIIAANQTDDPPTPEKELLRQPGELHVCTAL
jgi:hypothetical protein